ncbi:MAG: hypothetical protein DRG59_00025 [Deltaproteobacteria bacterium]|nr:MAG: hypothetical protein DRG83_08040 [Deltaproteobacteria bacterium]RLB10210.1 MAG: hypothetical protein DRG59_00025 [Deltaproteobacteria bacterium]
MIVDLEIRCPKLGHQVKFDYCEKEQISLPCKRIIKCWQIYFPVEIYLKKKLTEEEWNRCFNEKPKEKILTLLELIDAAKRRKEKKGQSKDKL